MERAEIEADLAEHDHDIDAIRKLLKAGIWLVVRVEQAQLESDRRISQLLISQEKTDKQVQALVKAIERGRNGNGKAAARLVSWPTGFARITATAPLRSPLRTEPLASAGARSIRDPAYFVPAL